MLEGRPMGVWAHERRTLGHCTELQHCRLEVDIHDLSFADDEDEEALLRLYRVGSFWAEIRFDRFSEPPWKTVQFAARCVPKINFVERNWSRPIRIAMCKPRPRAGSFSERVVRLANRRTPPVTLGSEQSKEGKTTAPW
jgi:hypothetical protein